MDEKTKALIESYEYAINALREDKLRTEETIRLLERRLIEIKELEVFD